MQLYVGVPMTREVNEKLYGALWKLMEYESTGLDPEEVERMKEELQQYRQIGTAEECKAAREKQVAISREIIEGQYFCPKCHNLMQYPGYCGCGQRLY